jgi:hypothetical protein
MSMRKSGGGAVQPSRADVHVDRPLTNISIAFMQNPAYFIADQVFPNIPVSKQSDRYFTYDRGMFNRSQMQMRAPSAESAGITYSIDSTPNYFAETFALHRDIPDQVRANADSPINLDREATELLSMQALLKREVTWAAAYFTTSKWTGDQTGVDSASPGANQFGQFNRADSNPIEVIRASATTIHERTGFRPNTLVMGRRVYDTLLDHPDIIGRINAGQTPGGPAMTLRRNLAALFEVDRVLVMDAIQNTAAEGDTNVHAFIGGKSMLLVYSAPNPGIMVPSGGYTFSWTGLLGSGAMGNRISRFRMEHFKSDRVEIEQSYVQKLVAADLGVFFATAVA